MSKLLRIAPAALLIAATTFLAPAIPAKSKDKSATAQTQAAEKEAKHHKAKHAKHKTATGAAASTSQTPATPSK